MDSKKICIQWNKSVRNFFELPNNTHRWILGPLLNQPHISRRMSCISSCIYCILYYYDDNIPLLKPNALKLYNMYHNTLSPWNTKMSVFTFPGIDLNLPIINKVLYSHIHYITHQNI